MNLPSTTAILLISLLLSTSLQTTSAKSKRQKQITSDKNARISCTRNPPPLGCFGLFSDGGGDVMGEEGQNCVNKCVSEGCFNEVYSGEIAAADGGDGEEGVEDEETNPTPTEKYRGESTGLEDGEVDFAKVRQFSTCVRKEWRDGKKMRDRARKEEREIERLERVKRGEDR